jgi:ribonuclease HII
MKLPSYKYELAMIKDGFTLIAGCDEVGRGPLAGPVVAAAVILDPVDVGGRRSGGKWWSRVRDSKTVSEKERQALALFIQENCLHSAQGTVSHETVDSLNIHHAAISAMKQAVERLGVKPGYLLVDGKHYVKGLEKIPQAWVVDGDALVLSIAAASILAKVARDRIMDELHEIYPRYQFHRNKGYGTRAHLDAIRKHGPCPVHRKTFGLVKQILAGKRRVEV